MDSFEFNKIAGALLGTLLLVMGLGIVSEGIFHRAELEQKGYVVELPEEDSSSDGAVAEVEVDEPIAVRLASADASAGQGVARKCASCHSFDEGGANKVGPALWGVLGATPGQHEGFKYSSAMVAYGEANVWDYENLDGFIAKPKEWVDGTSMGYAGLKNAGDRADLIAYLRTLAASPLPLPEVVEASTTEEASDDDADAASTEETMEQEADTEEPSNEATADDGMSADSEESGQDSEEAPEEDASDEDASVDETMPSEDTASTDEPDTPAETADAAGDLSALVASADIAEGQKVARRCSACHTFDEGGANRVGPNLWNIVGQSAGLVEDYKYSSAMSEYGQSNVWTLENLNGYIENPREFIPDNKMAFRGLAKEDDRLNMLAYLQSLSN